MPSAPVQPPSIGQVWERNGRKRKITAISEMDGQIGWERPGNDWKTYFVLLRTWATWANDARLIAEAK